MRDVFIFILIILTFSCNNKEKKETNILAGEKLEFEDLIESQNLYKEEEENIISSAAPSKDLIDPQNPYLIDGYINADYQFDFDPLGNDELLTYEYGKYLIKDEEYIFCLSAKNIKSGEERVLGYWNIIWGICQLSANKKSGLFFLDTGIRNRVERPLLKVDGSNGRVNYLMDINLSAMSSHDLTYLLFRSKYEGIFTLVDLGKNEIVRSFEWRKDGGQWGIGGYRIFRSLNPQYNFRIDFDVEGPMNLATAYYNIEHDQLDTVFDVTGSKSGDDAREREKILPEELGR